MSFNRNKAQDAQSTSMEISNPTSSMTGKNWLDHAGAAAKIDKMLLRGATMDELLTSGRSLSSVRSHLNHLKSDHGLSISNNNGVYRFY